MGPLDIQHLQPQGQSAQKCSRHSLVELLDARARRYPCSSPSKWPITRQQHANTASARVGAPVRCAARAARTDEDGEPLRASGHRRRLQTPDTPPERPHLVLEGVDQQHDRSRRVARKAARHACEHAIGGCRPPQLAFAAKGTAGHVIVQGHVLCHECAGLLFRSAHAGGASSWW